MNEDPLKNQNPKQEQLAIKVEIATEKDWESYRDLRRLVMDSKDAKMFGPKQIEEDRTKTEEGWRKDISSPDRFVVLAWQATEPIGMSLMKKKEAEGVWDIGSAYMKDNSRGKVFPGKALTIVLSEIKKRGGTKALIATKVDNTDMIRLAELLGFKKLDIEDVWQKMELDLTKPAEKL